MRHERHQTIFKDKETRNTKFFRAIDFLPSKLLFLLFFTVYIRVSYRTRHYTQLDRVFVWRLDICRHTNQRYVTVSQQPELFNLFYLATRQEPSLGVLAPC